jgi:hypothetical protein
VPARRTLLILGLILLVGLGLRVYKARHPIPHPGVDADTYSSIARQLYQDHNYGATVQDATDWSPGAPLLYSAVYFATGGVHAGAARLLVALLGTATIVVVFFLGRRLGGDATGLLAAGLTAVYPYFVYDAGRLMSEPLGCLALASAMLAFLWVADPGRPLWAWAVPGLLFGVTALARPEYLLFGPVFAVLVYLRARRPGRASSRAFVRLWRGHGRPRHPADLREGSGGPRPMVLGWRPAPAVVFLGAFVLAILPWTIRNYVVLDRVVPISTGGGKALFIGTFLPGDGNHFKTKIVLYHRFHPGSHRSDERILESDPRPLLDQVAARYPNLSRDSALAKVGREDLKHYLLHQPLDYAAMLARKARRMWSPSGKSMSSAGAVVMHCLLLAFGLGGLVLLALRRRAEALWFGLVMLGITFTGMLLLAGTRRNVVLMPLVITLASFAATQLALYISSRRGRPAHSPVPG